MLLFCPLDACTYDCLSVCLSVCHTPVLSKRLDMTSNVFHLLVAQYSDFSEQKAFRKSVGVTPTPSDGVKYRFGVNISSFRPINRWI